MFRRIFVGLLVLGFATYTGCGAGDSNPKTYPVTGNVTKGGKAVAGANVVFVSLEQGGTPAVAITDSEGKYSLTSFSSGDGAVPGLYAVKVSQYPAGAAPSTSDSDRYMTLEEQNAKYNPDEKQAAGPKNQLPEKYASEVTSGLKHTVTTSPTTFDIEIK